MLKRRPNILEDTRSQRSRPKTTRYDCLMFVVYVNMFQYTFNVMFLFLSVLPSTMDGWMDGWMDG